MSFDICTLKIIALVTMIIDHSAVVFRNEMSGSLYLAMRCVGRLSFPIFCFVLTEGFFHTRDRRKFFLRLSLFAVLSEIPFDLVLEGTYLDMLTEPSLSALMDFSAQNVFFTLAIGFMAMCFMERFKNDPLAFPAVFILAPVLGEVIRCDYGGMGVMAILLFYLGKKYGKFAEVWGFLPLLFLGLRSKTQPLCIFALPLLLLYNGKRGKNLKFFFYAAYPLHLLILLAIKLLHQMG